MKGISSIVESKEEEGSKNEENIAHMEIEISDSQNASESQRLRMGKELKEHDRRETLFLRRVNLVLEIGDHSYSKPATQCIFMPEVFSLKSKSSEPTPIIANPTMDQSTKILANQTTF